MKRSFFLILGLLGGSVLFLAPRYLQGVEIAPATARDILYAIGPDARGLSLSQDRLPDLFALTASRLEENPKQFTVVEPYLSGRWKGGKAVIEYARDLSYTLVSIYDKDGNRQRIYSVRTKFNEHIAQEEAETEPVVNVDNPGWQKAVPSAAAPGSESGSESRRSGGTMQVASNTQPNVSYEWDNARGAYIPVVSRGETSVTQETQETQPATSTVRRHHKHRHQTGMVVASARTTPTGGTTGQTQASLPAPMQDSGIWIPPSAAHKTKPKHKTKSKPAEGSSTSVKAADATWVERPASKDTEEETPPTPKTKPAETMVVASRPSSTEASRSGGDWVPPSVQETPVKKTRESSSNRASEDQVPSTEELIAGNDSKPGPDTSNSDTWVPKATPKPAAVEPEMPESPRESMKVAMVPKSAPADNSVDNLLKMAEQGKGEMPHESDTWVPQHASPQTTEADLNKEIERIRAQEKQQAAVKTVAPVKHDVNNPEEGVLPVSSFEKFSGPMYGRHREYERRFYPGKKEKAKVQQYDFYVDEVDRKKEIHNIYYYLHEKGKAPKLVAVERHDKVSFMSNYDIDKEDSGKISEYN